MDRNNRRQNNNFDGRDWDGFTNNNQYRGNGYNQPRQNPNRPNNPNFSNQQRQSRNNNQPFTGLGQDYLQTCMCKNCTKKRHPVIKAFVIIFVILAILGAAAGTLYAYFPKIRDWVVSQIKDNVKLPVNLSYKMMSVDTNTSDPVTVKDTISKDGQAEWKNFDYGQFTVFYQTAIKQQLVDKYYAAPSDVDKSFSLLTLGLLDDQKKEQHFLTLLA